MKFYFDGLFTGFFIISLFITVLNILGEILY